RRRRRAAAGGRADRAAGAIRLRQGARGADTLTRCWKRRASAASRTTARPATARTARSARSRATRRGCASRSQPCCSSSARPAASGSASPGGDRRDLGALGECDGRGLRPLLGAGALLVALEVPDHQGVVLLRDREVVIAAGDVEVRVEQWLRVRWQLGHALAPVLRVLDGGERQERAVGRGVGGLLHDVAELAEVDDDLAGLAGQDEEQLEVAG